MRIRVAGMIYMQVLGSSAYAIALEAPDKARRQQEFSWTTASTSWFIYGFMRHIFSFRHKSGGLLGICSATDL